MRKLVFGDSDTNQAVQSQKMVRDLKFWMLRDCTIYIGKKGH